MSTLFLRGWTVSAAVLGVVSLAGWSCPAAATEEAAAKKADLSARAAKADGAELFNREWLPKDARARGGDGLGPVFNDTSCIACHNQGGAGGGGPASKNVDVLSVFANAQTENNGLQVAAPATLPQAMFRTMFGGFGGNAVPLTEATSNVVTAVIKDPKELARHQKKELAKIHPGFVNARSVVLHKDSTDPKYDELRAQMRGEMQLGQQAGTLALVADAEIPGVESVEIDFSGAEPSVQVEVADAVETKPEMQSTALLQTATAQRLIQRHRSATQQFRNATQGTQAHIGNFVFLGSQRNPTALYGIGLIDSIPSGVIEKNAQQKHKDFPEVQGRVARLKDGRIGRFGWKNQTATLYDFAMTACAVELGLDVPDHPQAGLPHNKDYKSPGHDMTQEECDALVDYLKKLPAPERARPAGKQQATYLAAGEKAFAAVGCTACHTSDLGNVQGLYSDLLLHDMGQDLGDTGAYGIFVPNSPEEGGDEPIPSLSPQHGGIVGTGIMGGGATSVDRQNALGALRQEWRTPPLWGVRDSAPYLHDGRADTLEQAIALHGGEAVRSAQRFFELKPEERMQVIAFLKSLRAPDTLVAAR